MDAKKKSVHDFWNKASCGERLYLHDVGREDFLKQAEIRYKLEPYILSFAEFERYKNLNVLEIGVGLGADHQKFADAGAALCGLDFTERSLDFVRQRLNTFNQKSLLLRADAENLPFDDNLFDLVYSWGVLHHTPDIGKAIAEAYRVLKPGGAVKVMIYHKYSLVGYMLWFRYALLALKPKLSLAGIYDRYLESPGTKAYSVGEARSLFSKFIHLQIHTFLTHADLLTSAAGQRHTGRMLRLAQRVWPRRFFRLVCPKNGLFMTIKGKK